jgi:glucose-6-phosphate-specific signal transduction histidine kinase
VLEERTRISRELHDMVAHHLSLIAVQAETAPFRLSELPENAQAEFASVSQVAREALAEMRRLLGVLRQDQPAQLEPQPAVAFPVPCAFRSRHSHSHADAHVRRSASESWAERGRHRDHRGAHRDHRGIGARGGRRRRWTVVAAEAAPL